MDFKPTANECVWMDDFHVVVETNFNGKTELTQPLVGNFVVEVKYPVGH